MCLYLELALLASISSAVLRGVDGVPVTVEVHVSSGLPSFTVVGLPDVSCREARDRVRAAVLSSGLGWPQQRITVNLAPSGLPKAGAGLDLAMAVGVLVASGALEPDQVRDTAFLGELGLDGSLRPVTGLVPLVDAIGTTTVVVAPEGAVEAGVLGRHRVRAAASLAGLVGALQGLLPWERGICPPSPATDPADRPPDLAEVRGQPVARRALEVAAAGAHHLLMVGPPGAGKTMLAQRLAGLLPPLDPGSALQATKVHSAAGERLPPGGLLRLAPFRAPHHNASMAALVGGGSAWLRPGEISLATGGVLFLDELAEFSPAVLDALRQPLEEGWIRIARAYGAVQFPALPARGRHQPLRLRQRRHRGVVPLLGGGPASLSPAPFGTVARPVRPPSGRAPPRPGGAHRRPRRGVLGGGGGAGSCRPRGLSPSGCGDQPGTDPGPAQPPRRARSGRPGAVARRAAGPAHHRPRGRPGAAGSAHVGRPRWRARPWSGR
ncbi:MAG: ATP-binding protein [Acidimicrobiales bacterium]